MIQYISEIADEFLQNMYKRKVEGSINSFDYIKIISREIDGLNSLNFQPDKRKQFVYVRQIFNNLARASSFSHDDKRFTNLVYQLKEVLNTYGNYDEVNRREFNFISDTDLKTIIERDYIELSSVLIPDGAWKSAVVLSGSILESILYDVLSSQSFYANTMRSNKVPKYKGNPKDIKAGKWKLSDLIIVSEDIGLITSERVNTVDQVLRDFRNFVHPLKEIRSKHSCNEAEALMAKGSLDGICNLLDDIAVV